MAELMDYSPAAVSHYLSGRSPIPLQDIEKLAGVLQIPMDQRPRFELLVTLGHAPEVIEAKFLALDETLSALEARLPPDWRQAAANRAAESGTDYNPWPESKQQPVVEVDQAPAQPVPSLSASITLRPLK